MHLILDCDPGHDDAFALLIAGASKELGLTGVTTVAGNSYLHNTSRNARTILDLFDIDLPVFAGREKPLLRNIVIAPDIHGQSGLEGANLPAMKRPIEKTNAVQFMAETIEKYDDVTLVATGPLTNVALLILMHPHLIHKLNSIVLMGGGISFGNVTPVSEFNIFADAEAAKIVFESGVPIVMVPLDLTHQVIVTDEEIFRIRSLGQKFEILSDLLIFFKSAYKKVFGIEGVPLHDPCTVMYLLSPEIFESKEYHVDIETKGELTYGQTVVDLWNTSGKKANARVLLSVKRERFFQIFFEKISLLKGV
ncbi:MULTISPECIES: nucleoside hydrolase [Pseudothermotoga]|uniref:Purine nucleosidase n=1 Tax=Pseudothermotoga lettingae (strain ATCC BAA-301 / DSM 14385 / NBRC 107922 / TMO) TaxID=416591 RepID=A8F5Z9_PSELT|nr:MULTISPECIES: nucleoside hydrolase [Pseudothermotoga]MDI3494977.1 hypothetical protein [Pseudothermotoga sp.]ABV33583.1 Purine nucleosidase [Pseudothermotoga lettingae TMO]KUK21076.1 MAG: Purine nucleosidase [Pseudothermotoga lettingae]GLI49503.1 pyrimidine-specific ribonucleoside hydrolase RihA [Pseudothermotoga lettingae TMO]HBT26405.1 nucleoside hydrolase [Pseudothermotoga sp.]